MGFRDRHGFLKERVCVGFLKEEGDPIEDD